MRYSAIIPVYNNEATLSKVVETLLAHPKIREVIAVDDGSGDSSSEILKHYPGITVITHNRNRGKGAGIVSGWKAAKEENILTVDADLVALSTDHLIHMIDVYESEALDMVVAARAAEYMPFSWLSGERIYRKSVVMPYASLAVKVGNGIEQVINYAHRGKRVKLIVSTGIGHVLKYQRASPHVAFWQYLKEGWQLAKTEVYLRIGDI